jgi:hypothetical protein
MMYLQYRGDLCNTLCYGSVRESPRGAYRVLRSWVPRVSYNQRINTSFARLYLPSTRLTFPIHDNLVGVVIHLIRRYPTPSLPLSRLSSTKERPSCPNGASQPRRAHFVRPCARSDKPYHLTLIGITRIRLTSTRRTPSHLQTTPLLTPAPPTPPPTLSLA